MSNEDLNENEGATAPVDFALTPGRFQSDKIIDYSTESGRKLYKGATEPLKSLHDLSAENLRDFMNLLEQRAKIYDWVDILDIPDEGNQTYIHMLKQYGSISLKDVREHAKTYIGTETRAAQDSQQLADCIINSITVEARNSVTLCEDEYTIGEIISGTCLLKVVVRESHIDTNATTRIIREELTKLDNYMVSIDSNILKFNEHIKDLIKKLKSRGSITHDLLANLSKANKDKSDVKETNVNPQKTKSKWKRRDTRPSWMFVAPKQGEPTKKTVNSKVWQWCSKHQAWGRHTQSECKGKGYYPNKRTLTKDDTSDKNKIPPSKKLKIANALSSIT